MTDFNSVQRDKAGTLNKATDFLAPSEIGGTVRVAYAEHIGGVHVLGPDDRIALFELPKGARPLLHWMRNESFGTGITMNIGTDSDEALFDGGFSVAAPSSRTRPIFVGTLTADEVIYVKLRGADPLDTVDFRILILYAVD